MLNPYFVTTVLVIACGGIPKGYDEGGFSASITLQSFVRDFNLSGVHQDAVSLADKISNITSLGVLGAAFGAIVALLFNDRLGRLRTWHLAILLWATGLFVQIFSSGILGLLYFSRILSGFGAGAGTVCSPLYLSEIAPAKIRGMITTVYMIFLLFFLSLGFFVNFAVNATLRSTRTQYRLVQAIPLIPVGIALAFSFFLTDTPRWLASKGRRDAAITALARLRKRPLDDDHLRKELADIEAHVQTRAAESAKMNLLSTTKELMQVRTYRKRFLLLIAFHVIAQWTGGNAVTFYVSEIFESAGVGSQGLSLISAGAYGLVKLMFTVLFAVVLIDLIGRRPCFLAGLSLQLAAHVYLAVYMAKKPGSAHNLEVTNGAIAMIFIYAVGWSIGLCTIPYIYGSEIFPTRLRNMAYASTMALHWFLQFSVVKALPPMFVALHTWGVYVFFAAICALGMVILGLSAPETKRVALEHMDSLFEAKWYLGWRAIPPDDKADLFAHNHNVLGNI